MRVTISANNFTPRNRKQKNPNYWLVLRFSFYFVIFNELIRKTTVKIKNGNTGGEGPYIICTTTSLLVLRGIWARTAMREWGYEKGTISLRCICHVTS